jgi:phosphatidylglycerol---prolipoprotein diacylglyceryl transferase
VHRIIFQAGPLTLYSYGLFVALGSALAILLIIREASRRGMEPSDILDIMMGILLGGLLGGRLLFVVINWRDYAGGPLWDVLNIAEGGLAFQGALAAGALSGAVLVRIKKLSFWRVSDLIAPYLALAQAIGRIGCFFNGCCYGKETAGCCGVTFPGEEVMRIPVQLYSSLGLMIIFLVLLRLREKTRFDGYIFCMYLMLYPVFRFLMDLLRGDDLAMVSVLTLSQVISIATLALGGFLYFVRAKDQKKLD